jgi:hypothetical protein
MKKAQGIDKKFGLSAWKLVSQIQSISPFKKQDEPSSDDIEEIYQAIV